MKQVALSLFILLVLPLKMLAQYGGGNGRGEKFTAISSNELNGKMLNIYGGGNGRGEDLTAVNSNQLNGTMLNIYGGGNGRGEDLTAVNTNQLNGSKLNIYGGGNGRGEILKAIGNNQLNGQVFNIYNGGNGRGEIANTINTNGLDGAMTLMFHGGNGRGETNAFIKTLQLDGVVASLYMGGNGRGETMFQLNNQGLPAQIGSFGAVQNGKEIKVFWQTTSEKNCDSFTIEKSVDGNNWQPIGTVPSAGNSTVTLSYQFFDVNPVAGANYYQLKTIGKDGKSFYSTVAVVYYSLAAPTTINVFPNPVKAQFTFTISGMDAKLMPRLDVNLISAGGQSVLQKKNLTGNTQTIDIANLSAGTYYLLVTINGVVSKVQVVKQ